MPRTKESNRELYCWRKENKICIKCGKKKAHKNLIMCLDCRDKENLRKWIKYQNIDSGIKEKLNKKKREHAKERRKILKEQGLCITCGKRKIATSISEVRCMECFNKKRNEEKRKQRETGKILRLERYEYGLCYNCAHKGLYKGTHYCKDCWSKMSIARKEWWKNKGREKEGPISGIILEKRIKRSYRTYYGLIYPKRYQFLIQRENKEHEYEIWIDVNKEMFEQQKIGELYKV